jgi:hypothetical protein
MKRCLLSFLVLAGMIFILASNLYAISYNQICGYTEATFSPARSIYARLSPHSCGEGYITASSGYRVSKWFCSLTYGQSGNGCAFNVASLEGSETCDVLIEGELDFDELRNWCFCDDHDNDGHYYDYKENNSKCPLYGTVPMDDCQDFNQPTVYGGAPELCDGKDNNCNGQIDEGLYADNDGDGHYVPNSCKNPKDDCDDSDNTVYPGALELATAKITTATGRWTKGALRSRFVKLRLW